MLLWFGFLLFCLLLFSASCVCYWRVTHPVPSTEAVTIHSVIQAVALLSGLLLTAIVTATVPLCVVEAPSVKPQW